MKTLDPVYLAPIKFSKFAKGSDDFACACVRVEFRLHLGHPYCLRLFLHAVVLVSLVKTRLSVLTSRWWPGNCSWAAVVYSVYFGPKSSMKNGRV